MNIRKLNKNIKEISLILITQSKELLLSFINLFFLAFEGKSSLNKLVFVIFPVIMMSFYIPYYFLLKLYVYLKFENILYLLQKLLEMSFFISIIFYQLLIMTMAWRCSRYAAKKLDKFLLKAMSFFSIVSLVTTMFITY